MGHGKVAFVSGISGQLGSYLAEHLLSCDGGSAFIHGRYRKIHGLIRPSSDVVASRERIECFASDPRVELHYGDLCDQAGLVRLLKKCQPDEIYNLAAQSHVKISFDLPCGTGDVTGLGCLRMLEAMRESCPEAKFYQASSSELFGSSPPPQNEQTPMEARSPYAAAKLFAYSVVKNYREAYGLHLSNGILFNSESPRRGPGFVTRKIARGVARISLGLDCEIRLGNLSAMRDWMHAKDAVRGMHLILQREKPDDYVLATGKANTVRRFISLAAECVGLRFDADQPLDAVSGRFAWPLEIDDRTVWVWKMKPQVVVDPAYMRPTEVPYLCGDSSKARQVLGWQPTVTLEELVKEMVEADLKREGGRC